MSAKASKASYKRPKKIEEKTRDEILDAIVASWTAYPEQTRAFTAQETKRIARLVFGRATKTNKMRVAGVRAALAQGRYPDSGISFK